MSILLNPVLEALDVARKAAAGATRPDDDVIMHDHPDHWVFEFTPHDSLGGGARVSIAKDDLRVQRIVRTQ